MILRFDDCSFDDFYSEMNVDIGSGRFKVIEIDSYIDEDSFERHRIADIALQDALEVLLNSGKITNEEFDRIDENISYYSEGEESLYSIVESITGEPVRFKRKDSLSCT